MIGGRRIGRIPPWWRRFKRNGYRRERCEGCGHPFRWSRDARHSFGNRDGKTWHGPCLSLVVARSKAEDRLRVVALMAELSGLTASDVRGAMGLRDAKGQPNSGSNGWNLAWRVFYDLERADPHDHRDDATAIGDSTGWGGPVGGAS